MPDDKKPVLFISHHSSKLQTAEHVEKALAARGVRCWIAPRDVEPGEPFDRAVHKAIGDTDAMLLLFCSQSEKSRHVKRELILADQLNKAIIPLRLERIDPGELSYHLADSQWIDWLEKRDDVIERIAAKAREFYGKGHADDPAPDATPGSVPWPSPVSAMPDWSMPTGGNDATLPIDLPDAAPSHSAAVGAASDLQPHALGAFAGPGAAAMASQPADRAPGFGAAGYQYAPPPGMPPEPERGSRMALWFGLGALALVVAIAIAVVIGKSGFGGGNSASPATATADAQPITPEWFAGTWADSRDCAQPFRFDRSGQVTFPTGVQARWSIENGDTLVVELAGNQQRRRLERVGDDELRGDGGSTYRCFPGAT